jgi:hypothetical protein
VQLSLCLLGHLGCSSLGLWALGQLTCIHKMRDKVPRNIGHKYLGIEQETYRTGQHDKYVGVPVLTCCGLSFPSNQRAVANTLTHSDVATLYYHH